MQARIKEMLMIEAKKVCGILVAGGSSKRMGFDKLFYRIHCREVVMISLEKLTENPLIDEVVLVVSADNLPRVARLLEEAPQKKPVRLVKGGETRAHSVAQGVEAAQDAYYVAIHDAARPFVSDELITRLIRVAAEAGAAAPALPVQDTVKRVSESVVAETVPRADLATVQTPQVFVRERYLNALANISKDEFLSLTDDCMVLERAGLPVMLVEGEQSNRKLTGPEDLMGEIIPRPLRIGHGYDVHRLVTGRPLVLGGVTVPHPKGLQGHSDADVLCHAVCDAMLGALALGDLGQHFPDTDPSFSGVSSLWLLSQCLEKVKSEGYMVQNVDATLLCQSPKLAGHSMAMRKNLAKALQCEIDCISVKATTEEGLGFTGKEEGIAAHCVLLLYAQ